MSGSVVRGVIWVPVTAVGIAGVVAGALFLRPTSHVAGSAAPPSISLGNGTAVRQNDSDKSISTVQPLSPSQFHSHACVAFAPTRHSRDRTVFVDAGHGGPDMGAIGTTSHGHQIREKTMSLDIAEAATRALRADGYRVVMSRTADNSVTKLRRGDVSSSGYSSAAANRRDLLARVHCANLAGADALVSIHLDSYPDSSVTGATTIYDAVRPFHDRSRQLAEALQKHIVRRMARAHTPIRDRGIQTDTSTGGGDINEAGSAYGHLILLGPAKAGHVEHPTTMPGALIEPAFLSNPDEAHLVSTKPGQAAIGAGIADAVADFLSH